MTVRPAYHESFLGISVVMTADLGLEVFA